MTKQSVVIDLPDAIYNKYKHRAQQMQRSVVAEIVESIVKCRENAFGQKRPAFDKI